MYDSAGNPTSFKGLAQTFNPNNQNAAHTWDMAGNPTAYKGQSLTWDAESRLTSYGAALTEGYTGDDLRAWKQTGANRTYFLYDGETPIIELDSAGNVLAAMTYGDSGLLSRRAGGASVFYQFDAQGSVAQRLDSAQNVLSSLLFDAWGVGQTSGGADCFGYNAQWSYYTDLETGLHALSYRHYDPAAGRFLNRDPAEAAGGLNLYAYVGNQATFFADPFGLWPDRGRGGKTNIRQTDLQDMTDQDIEDELDSLKNCRTKEDKARRGKLQREQKGRAERNRTKREEMRRSRKPDTRGCIYDPPLRDETWILVPAGVGLRAAIGLRSGIELREVIGGVISIGVRTVGEAIAGWGPPVRAFW